mgnify:CR=1 FL=1
MRDTLAGQRALLVGTGGLLVLFLVLPLLALLLSTSGSDLILGIRSPLVLPALRLSLMTTSVSLLVVVALGTPLAWTLAQRTGTLPRFVETLLQLPVVVPPAVAGVALLLAFGRRGLFTSTIAPGSSLAFSGAAVILAEIFVSAPFFVQAATSAFRRIDGRWLVVARSFGASPLQVFFRIGLPLAAPGLVAGAAMTWARSLGEFGATVLFAGNLEGKTQTLPLAIYTTFESDLRVARTLSIFLLVAAFVLLFAVRLWLKRALPLERIEP